MGSKQVGQAPVSRALLSCLAYSAASCSMVLLNKAVLSKFDYDFKACIMVLQGLVALGLMLLSKRLGILQFRELEWKLVRVWLPVNVFFTLMLYTSFESLKRLHVPAVTIFKNLTNIIIAAGAWWRFGESISVYVSVSLGLVVLGALFAGATDLGYDPVGYAWMLANCVCTACYVLYMRETVRAPLSTWDKAFLNNALTVPMSAGLAAVIGELPGAVESPLLPTPLFVAAIVLSGAVGFLLNLSSLWCVSETSATTYSMVGALNKIPVALAGALLFGAPMDARSWVFVAFGLAAGVVYAYAKTVDPDKRIPQKPPGSPQGPRGRASVIGVSPHLDGDSGGDSPPQLR